MANQFEGMYEDLDKVLHIEFQREYKTFKVVDPGDESRWWGGFRTIAGARRYALYTLGAVRAVVTGYEVKP
jgi:hypothetical protein